MVKQHTKRMLMQSYMESHQHRFFAVFHAFSIIIAHFETKRLPERKLLVPQKVLNLKSDAKTRMESEEV